MIELIEQEKQSQRQRRTSQHGDVGDDDEGADEHDLVSRVGLVDLLVTQDDVQTACTYIHRRGDHSIRLGSEHELVTSDLTTQRHTTYLRGMDPEGMSSESSCTRAF